MTYEGAIFDWRRLHRFRLDGFHLPFQGPTLRGIDYYVVEAFGWTWFWTATVTR